MARMNSAISASKLCVLTPGMRVPLLKCCQRRRQNVPKGGEIMYQSG
jgi:hypothetical protein